MGRVNNQSETILLLGATSGIGQAYAREALRHGASLVLGARNTEKLRILYEDLKKSHPQHIKGQYSFDMINTSEHENFLKIIFQNHPEIRTCLVTCGVLYQEKEYRSNWQKAEEMIQCNFTGHVSLIEKISDYFMNSGGGFISVITSIAGDVGFHGSYLYGGTKAALNIYLQGLRKKTHAGKVFIQTIKLGPVWTPMVKKITIASLTAQPEYAAKKIYQLMQKKCHVVYLPSFWRFIMICARLVPQCLSKRLPV